jgi:phosphoribosyl 1,2-cyclic phosphate phosphodiesterase
MPVFAFKFGKTAYITDVNHIPPEQYPMLGGLDLLILEAFRFEPHFSHYSLDEAVEVAKTIGAKQTYFTHASHVFDHETINRRLPKGMALAYDGLRLTVTSEE